MMAVNKSGRMPTGKLARTGVAGMAMARVGAGRLARTARQAMGGTRGGDDDYGKEAHIVFEALSQLRGPALKLAQTLSLEMGWLPKAYQDEFQKALYKVPPLNRAVIRRLITAEFGQPPEKVFSTFEPEAFAAASLGQVHRATDPNGRTYAVKVQYPGVKEALHNDLALGRRLLGPMLRSAYVNRVMGELEARFSEEADYCMELQNTEWFLNHMNIPGIRIPRPLRQWSTSRVIATELMPGLHLEEWLAAGPSQQARDSACQRIWDQFCHFFFEHGRIHADPNPGNFLFQDDGSVAMIDFGCVKQQHPDLASVVSRYFRAGLRGDRDGVLEAYAALGIDRESFSRLNAAVTVEFDEWLFQPFRQDCFDFGAHPGYAQKMMDVLRESLNQKAMQGFTSETIMFDRNLHGYFNLFGRLGARVRMRNSWMG